MNSRINGVYRLNVQENGVADVRPLKAGNRYKLKDLPLIRARLFWSWPSVAGKMPSGLRVQPNTATS